MTDTNLPPTMWAYRDDAADLTYFAHTEAGRDDLLERFGDPLAEYVRHDLAQAALEGRDDVMRRLDEITARGVLIAPDAVDDIVRRVAERLREPRPGGSPPDVRLTTDPTAIDAWHRGESVPPGQVPRIYEIARIVEPFATYELEHIGTPVLRAQDIVDAAASAVDHAAASVSATARAQAAERQRDDARAEAQAAKIERDAARARLERIEGGEHREWRAAAKDGTTSDWVRDQDAALAIVETWRSRSLGPSAARARRAWLETRTAVVSVPEKVQA